MRTTNTYKEHVLHEETTTVVILFDDPTDCATIFSNNQYHYLEDAAGRVNTKYIKLNHESIKNPTT